MKGDSAVIPMERIERMILLIRGQKVMLDSDLADLYGVRTKRLNEQVKRNAHRFPADFMFQLTAEEKSEVVANCDHLRGLRFSPTKPYAFTEHGALMVASVLNSPRAVDTSVFVIRAFVRLRQLVVTHRELARKIEELDRRSRGHDVQIRALVDAIRRLMAPDVGKPKRIGFGAEN
ncbi:MAG: ORF6N domain protein [Verrucomicrobia bacterium ADurb.Bin345]|nr:MAG: ORF6N domain protein [Verrucomicrobia bacterium ADurb.Bin345]